MEALLLGGWQHVAADVRKLAVGLEALPEACMCGDGSAHLAGGCQCCRNGERTLDSGCTDCESLLASLRDDIDELADASLRFLPFVDTMTTAGGNGSQHAGVVEVQGQIRHVAAVFTKLSTAADEFRSGCCGSHTQTLKALTGELAAATRHLDSLLTPVPAPIARLHQIA